MKTFLHSAKFLALDMASTLLFLALFLTTHNLTLAVALGMALGVGQIGYALYRRQKIDAMQWLSVILVLTTGAASLITHDPRFVMIKGTVVYVVVGVVMLQRGWMTRYLPPIALQWVPDYAIGFGYVWAGLMFFSAALNLVLAFTLGAVAWAAWMSAWAMGSKIALFLIQYSTMRIIGGRRGRADAGAALTA